MPIYNYTCRKCSNDFDIIQSWGASEATCPKCGEKCIDKNLFAPAVHYKGPGFYTTESRGITGHKRKPNIKVGNADKDGNPID